MLSFEQLLWLSYTKQGARGDVYYSRMFILVLFPIVVFKCIISEFVLNELDHCKVQEVVFGKTSKKHLVAIWAVY